MSKRPAEIFSRVVRWAVLAFFVYALVSGSFHFRLKDQVVAEKSPGTVAITETHTAPEKDCASKSGLDDFAMLAPAFMPATRPVIKSEDIRQGTGEAGGVCGQSATLHFEYALQNGKVLYSNMSGDEAHVIIGDGQLLRGLELGMVGMQPGGERRIAFPASLGFGAARDPKALLGASAYAQDMQALKSQVIMSKVSLTALSPRLPDNTLQLRVIDHTIGGGVKAQCGDTVSTEMTLWKLDGTKLFSTHDNGKPAVFRLGASAVPFGIEQAVINMTENSERTIILPAAYVKPLLADKDTSAESPFGDLTLPNETMLVEVHLQHVGENEAAPKPAPDKKPLQEKPVKDKKDHDASDTDDSHQ